MAIYGYYNKPQLKKYICIKEDLLGYCQIGKVYDIGNNAWGRPCIWFDIESPAYILNEDILKNFFEEYNEEEHNDTSK